MTVDFPQGVDYATVSPFWRCRILENLPNLNEVNGVCRHGGHYPGDTSKEQRLLHAEKDGVGLAVRLPEAAFQMVEHRKFEAEVRRQSAAAGEISLPESGQALIPGDVSHSMKDAGAASMSGVTRLKLEESFDGSQWGATGAGNNSGNDASKKRFPSSSALFH